MNERPADTPQDTAALRRNPRQARSRRRVEEILAAAMRLIGEQGIDRVTMRDIAREIDAPLSVIYQYFPNKSAILARLHNGVTDQTRGWTAAAVAGIHDRDSLISTLSAVFDGYAAAFRQEPALADIISAVQADKSLEQMDISDSRWHAEVLINASMPFVRPEAAEEYRRSLFLIAHLIGALMRLLLAMDENEADLLLQEYKDLARRSLEPLLK